MKKIITLFVLLFCVSAASAQDDAPAAAAPVIDFEETEHDFAIVREDGKKVTHDFVFKNNGTNPLVLTRIITSCKCVSTSYPKKPVQPGGEGIVSVTYDPKKQQGVFYKAIQVFSNAPEGVEVLIIKGEVEKSSR